MADVHTKKQRSKNMSAVRSRYNLSTEIALVNFLKSEKIKGWRRHLKNIPGTPDFVFPKCKLAIFVDGCFWHGCKKCKLRPETNKDFWDKKINANKERDEKINKELTCKGWHVLRFWEHEIKKEANKKVTQIIKFLNYVK